LPAAFPQSVHRYADRAFLHAQRFCGVGVGQCALAGGEKDFGLLELFRATVRLDV
jgi:hypothetical protein